MAKNRGRIAAVIGAAFALFAALALSAQPASAQSGHETGTKAETARCSNSPYYECLFWYGDRTGSYWGFNSGVGTGHGDSNLGDNYFLSGTGAGAGTVVRNNAAAMDCDYNVLYDCASYYSPGYAGNYDYAFYGTGGTLFFTWNDEASVYYL